VNSGGLWAVTAYFNPVGYARRRANYRAFRRHLVVPLVTVELGFDGRFELVAEDADILVQIHGEDLMWQKERLLNVALGHVPPGPDGIAWLDCDVVFGDDDWAARTARALDEACLVHLFRHRRDVGRGADPERLDIREHPPTSESAVHRLARGQSAPEDLCSSDAPLERRSTLGLAWACRREVLDAHGLYDACILGSGDRAITCAALGEFDYGARALLMNAQQAVHYRSWAAPFHAAVRGRVGCIEGDVFHLWHGDTRLRRYGARHRGIAEFDFDPSTDIALAPGGPWRWSSPKSALHDYVRDYFASRQEDGG
jgi:hypothetical protein